MKKMMLLGGLVGFLIGIVLGFANQGDWLSIFWKACVAAYLTGLMMRWWAKIWIRCLKDTFREKQKKEDMAHTISNELKETEA